MKILVSNIGSTSFKFRLFQMDGSCEQEIASGGADRIGHRGGLLKMQVAAQAERTMPQEFADHGAAIVFVLEQLVSAGALKTAGDLDAVAFKAVMAGDVDPVVRVDDELLAKMEYFIPVAPAHNPPYIAAMKMFRQVLKDTPLVAAFEPGFHRTVPMRRRLYAVPKAWAEQYGVKRYGYHGASHAYIASRIAQLMGGKARRVISCHLGGSSSICAIRDGQSVATSMGLSPQTGLPQGNRCGEFDPFAFALLKSRANLDTQQVLVELGRSSGMAALSGTNGDMRDVRQAAAEGKADAQMAIDMYATGIRDYIGSFLVELGGADAIVFTGGIGLKDVDLRKAVCDNLGFAGVHLDVKKNESAGNECRIDADGSQTALWVMATNEELVVARQAVELLSRAK